MSGGRGVGDQMVRLINIHVRVVEILLWHPSSIKASLYKRQVFQHCLQLSMLGCDRADMEKSSICCLIIV